VPTPRNQARRDVAHLSAIPSMPYSPPFHPSDPRRLFVTLRDEPRTGEPLRSVIIVERFMAFRPIEVVVLPEDEAHRLVWLGLAEAIGFELDPARAESEQKRHVAKGE
jgi:hypothetical protein